MTSSTKIRVLIGAATVALACVGVYRAAHAADDPTSASNIASYCEADHHTAQGGVCVGYVAGVNDQLALTNALLISSNQRPVACMPANGLSPLKVWDITKGYMAANPKYNSESASFVINMALKAAFPCH